MYRVIKADDEPWVIYSLIHIIHWEEYGFTICATAENGLHALEKCLALQPDVLFSDIRMPGLDGTVLLEKLRRELSHIEVVFISGFADFNYAQQAVRHGAFDYLLKQVSASQLSEALKRLKIQLDQKAMLTQSEAYFALLDETDKLSISEWLNCYSQYIAYPHYRFIVFLSKNKDQQLLMKDYWIPEIGQILLRTGRNKYSALIGYTDRDRLNDWILRFKKNIQHIGISNEECGDYQFSHLHKQADIAFYSSLLSEKDIPLEYNTDYPPDCEKLINESINSFESSLKNSDIDMCTQLLSQISKTCEILMLDRISEIYNVLISLLFRYRPYEAEGLEHYSYRCLGSEFTNIQDIFYF